MKTALGLAPTSQKLPRAVSTYAQLRDTLRETFLQGQRRIEEAKVQTYWQTGKIINDHLSQHANRSERYGKELVLRLSADLQVSDRLLYECLQFSREFEIPRARAKSSPILFWAHYRKLAGIPDRKKREALISRIHEESWTSRDLESEIKKDRTAKKLVETDKPLQLLKPTRGTLYTYRLRLDEGVNAAEPVLRVDLGFSCYKEMRVKGFKEGDIVESKISGAQTPTLYTLKKTDKTKADLFTFKATVERVVDGDTVIVQIDLGFDIWTRQYLRLRGLDCPELDTPEGKRAKKFVENAFASVPHIILTSTRADKYDRYLADIFYETGEGEKFLNNELLVNRLAVKM